MSSPTPTLRRDFLKTLAAGATVLAGAPRLAAATPAWTVGTLNRPWVKWSCDEMLTGAKAAGYGVLGLQTTSPTDAWVASESRAVLERNFSEKAIALSNQGDRWSKPGEPFKGGSRFIPDAAHRATKWTERFGVKVKNWWQGNGWQGNGGQDSWKRDDR